MAKAEEIIELRRQVRDRDGERLLACAGDMADRFAAGGRLFAFGNGGSSSDAQQLVTLFLNPGPGRRPLPAYGLTNDGAVMTALCNDIGVEVVFSRQIAAFGGKKTSRSACRPAATRPTCCAPSTRRAGAAC